ncbi:MAG TPA: chromosome segregation SMC family protein [Candidatus Bathyarchaeia archaeon]|nr:chromosome segregation SMC family protein [Candidatus Bathyarchaeia archaeon]
MFIKRIDIRGFKTFNKKVSINLGTGFTVITGPNGSGKSNILDSLKFALGELSPRELRGRSLSDLVHKSQGEGARSAYVAVQFDNSDRKLPVDSDLVTVSREFSKGGEGIYRLNGRRLSRKQVQDIMSSADIQVTGFNLISQHAITRLAEISTEERRRILESLIGIGTFETKKAEARVQLQEADLNLKVAAARVDEVRQRIEQLERERNDLLRFNLLKTEINSQQARILSAQILALENRDHEMSQTLQQELLKLDQVRREREDLTQQRAKIEAERRSFEEKTVTQGNQELFDIERRMAEASKGIVEAKSAAETARNLVATRTRQREAFTKQAEEMETAIKPLSSSIKSLHSHRKVIEEKLEDSTSKVEKISEKLTANRASLDQDTKKLRDVQDEIDGLGKELANLTAQGKGSSTKLDLTASHLQTLEARQKEFSQLSEELKTRIREMEKLQKEEEKRLETIEQKTKEYSELKDQRRKEIDEAFDIAKKARVTVVEFNTQKTLADNIGAEDKAIEKIEEMADEGALKGVYGRLEDLVKFPEEYRKAIQSASAGWMKALVVKNLEVAIRCVESLKRTKLGRVKIVPIEDLELEEELEVDNASGIVGPLSKVVRSDKSITPAVRFVFGDTILATTQRAAFLTAAKGQRCVVTSGDLYEPGGGLESGYYRAPLEISNLVPRSTALESLEKTVKSLETVVQRSRSDVDRIETELDELLEDRVSASKTREALARDVELAKKSSERTRAFLRQTTRRIDSLQNSMSKEKILLEETAEKQAEMKRRLAVREEERTRLRLDSRRSALSQLETERDQATRENQVVLREKLELESRLSSEQSSLETLRPGIDQIRIQLRALDSEIHREEGRAGEALERLQTLEKGMKQFTEEKERLVGNLDSVGDERKKYEEQFVEVEKATRKLLQMMDPLNASVTDLKAGLREVDAQLTIFRGQLSGLGFERPLETHPDLIKAAEDMKRALEQERDEIGAINQLAAQQYESQKEGYKHLSVRIGELEREKLVILDFMNELERRKLDTFMSAYNKVNETFQSIFREMTSEGNGRMVLDNPENPFEGGLDVLLQFPGKTELTIGSASGGEKSVSTVCYLLALQQIHPMPFYVMDEIDAHLDVLNAKRLATLLRSRSSMSQFIVISLKDTTISRAERVFGVFIDKGSSQIVSLPVRGENN